MHRANLRELDMPCNAWCEGDVHADLAYTMSWSKVTPENAHRSLQHIVDRRAQNRSYSPIEILTVSVAYEAPSVKERYPYMKEVNASGATAYLVRYRLQKEAPHVE